MNDKKQKGSDLGQVMKELGPYLNLGLQMLIPIVGGAFFGQWLDGKNETTPLWTIICAILGIAVGFYSFFKTISEAQKKGKNDKRRK